MVEIDNAGESAPGEVGKTDMLGGGESVQVEDQAERSAHESRNRK